MNLKIAIIGCGRAGGHFAFHLKERNLSPIALWDTSGQKAASLSKLTGIPVLLPEEMGENADTILLAVPDDLIRTSCETLAEKRVFRQGQKVFHLSGSQDASLLEKAKEAGAEIASLHPLQSFTAQISEKNPFKGILMTVEGMPEAVKTGLFLAEILNAKGMNIRAEAKILYHAAAAVASNYLVSLMDLAFDLLEASGIQTDDPLAFLDPLVEGTLANLRKMPSEKALTGPIARGDLSTISGHMNAIHEKCPERIPLYRELGKATLLLAKKSGNLDAERIQAMENLLRQN